MPSPLPLAVRTVPAPLHVVWLSTDACNARCLHCSSASATRHPDELTTDEVLRLVDDLADYGVFDLGISGGEPLLRPDILTVIESARSRGLGVGIGTNGAALTRRMAHDLAQVGVGRVQVSLDGLRREHDHLRAWPGLFDRAIAAVRTAHAAGLRVHVCCTITRLNAHLLQDFAQYVSELGAVSRINFSRFIPTGRGTSDLDLPDEAWRGVIKTVAEIKTATLGKLEVTTHLAQAVLVDEESRSSACHTGCQAARGQACITATGDVLPCVMLPLSMGNVRKAAFAKIWQESPVGEALRHREHLGGRCGDCGYRDRCGGCRAVAFARSGDVLAEDPRCWLS